MTRRRLPIVAALLALAVFAGVGWWLLGGSGDRDARRVPPPPVEESIGGGASGTAGPNDPRPQKPSSGEGGGSGVDEGGDPALPTPAPTPPRESIPGVSVLEDGRPLAGARIFSFATTLSSGPPTAPGTSDAGGRFALEPLTTLFRIGHPHARVVAVEGGETAREIPDEEAGWIRVVDRTGGLKVIFRDEPGTAHVRLVDSRSGEPLTSVAGLRLSYLFGEGLSGRAVYDYADDPGFGGWIPIREGALPEGLDLQVEPARVVVEFHLPGYAARRVPLPDIRGRTEVRVEPVEADARGEVAMGARVVEMPDAVTSESWPTETGKPRQVSATLRSLDADSPRDLQEVLGLPTRTGAFAVYGLPDGAYEIEVAATVGNTVLRGKKRFERHGGTAEIGTVVIEGAAGIAVRVVDPDGKAIPQAEVVVVREGEDPEKGRRLPVPEAGSVAVSDLEPGVPHRVVVFNLPRPVERPVVTPARNETKEVAIEWPDRLVACRIRLIVDGKAVANPDGSTTVPATVHESPVPRGRGKWNADGTFEAALVPGTYRFSVFAVPREGGDMALFAGSVTVPAGEAFEATLELQRGR